MHDDDILRGVWAAREAFARKYDFDMGRMFAALRAMDAAGDRAVVHLAPKPVTEPPLPAPGAPPVDAPPGAGLQSP